MVSAKPWSEGRLMGVLPEPSEGAGRQVRFAAPLCLSEDGPVGARLDTANAPGMASLSPRSLAFTS